MKNLKFYYKNMVQNFKIIFEYQSDFLITMVAAVLTQALGFIFIWVIYQGIPDINGWEFWEVAFMYAMIYFTEGVTSLLFQGIWSLSHFVNAGELDRMLLRPVSPFVQVISSEVGINGLGNMLLGLVIITSALGNLEITWTCPHILITLLLLLSAIVIRFSINLLSNSAAFWTQSPGSAFPMLIHNLSDFAKYPISIYPRGIQLAVSILVPHAFISFFPASYIFAKDFRLIGILTPVVAVLFLTLSIKVFYKGVSLYESAGH